MSDQSEYERPPVVEVVMGVQFAPLKLFSAWLGRFSIEGLKPTQELPPIPPVVEIFGNVLPPGINLAFDSAFPSPRTWFEDETKERLVQLQRDRLLVNWRKTGDSCRYPRYPNVSAYFFEQLDRFRSFVHAELGEPPHVQQLEITYVNHDPIPANVDIGRAMASVVPHLGWQGARTALPGPEAVDARYSFALPDLGGRLHIRLQNAFRATDMHPILLLELVVRGMPPDHDQKRWFALAHDRIVSAFDEITTTDAQERWGRKK